MNNLPQLNTIAIISFVIAMDYAGIHQICQPYAEDPPIPVTYDAREQVQSAISLPFSFPYSRNMEKTTAFYQGTYDVNTKPVLLNSYFHGLPQWPKIRFENAGVNREDWINWHPERNLRMGMDISKVQASPFGKNSVDMSLCKAKKHEAPLFEMIFSPGWFAATLCAVIDL